MSAEETLKWIEQCCEDYRRLLLRSGFSPEDQRLELGYFRENMLLDHADELMTSRAVH